METYRLIEMMRTGIIKPSEVVKYEATRRVRSFIIDINVDSECCSLLNDVDSKIIDLDKQCGRFLITSAAKRKILLFDAMRMDEECKSILAPIWSATTDHRKTIECVQWFPNDNGIFMSSDLDGHFFIWDVKNLRIADKVKCNSGIHLFSVSPTGFVAAAHKNGEVSLLKLGAATPVNSFRAHVTGAYCCVWSPLNEHHLLTGGEDGNINLFDTRSFKGKVTTMSRFGRNGRHFSQDRYCSHHGVVRYLRYIKNGLNVLSMGTDRQLKVWNDDVLDHIIAPSVRETQSRIAPLQAAVVECTKPRFVFVPMGYNVYVHELDSGKQIGTLIRHARQIVACCYNEFVHELYVGYGSVIERLYSR